MTEREEFEKWVSSKNWSIASSDGVYVSEETRLLWQAFHAGRASQRPAQGVDIETLDENQTNKAIYEIKKKYHAELAPYFSRLVEFYDSKPPPPVILPDGRAYQYIGPLAKPPSIKPPTKETGNE